MDKPDSAIRPYPAHPDISIALYQPDIAGNVGTILRLAACLDLPVHIIEPCGFAFGDRALKRAGMDYAAQVDYHRHVDWQAFRNAITGSRLVLLSTKGAQSLPDFRFLPGDVILLGSESSGVPGDVHDSVDARVYIPLRPGMRSLNVAIAAGMATAKALCDTQGFPRSV